MCEIKCPGGVHNVVTGGCVSILYFRIVSASLMSWYSDTDIGSVIQEVSVSWLLNNVVGIVVSKHLLTQ